MHLLDNYIQFSIVVNLLGTIAGQTQIVCTGSKFNFESASNCINMLESCSNHYVCMSVCLQRSLWSGFGVFLQLKLEQK